jgi:tight adherence protein B
MNASATQLAPLAWLGVVLFAIGVAVALYITLTDEESPLAKLYFRYAAHLDGELRALFLHDVKGTTIVNWQLGVGFTSLVFDPVYTLLVGESTGVPIALIGIPIVAAAPALWFIDARHKRQEKIEQQLDTFLLALANALKASPSLGDALNATSTLLRAPMKEELELTVKENQLGVPLDQALLNMARRVGSRAFSGALTTVLIGRQTGGDLSRISGDLRRHAARDGPPRRRRAHEDRGGQGPGLGARGDSAPPGGPPQLDGPALAPAVVVWDHRVHHRGHRGGLLGGGHLRRASYPGRGHLRSAADDADHTGV